MKQVLLIIVLIFISVIILGAAVFLSASSLVNIPVFSDVLYGKKVSDLGMKPNAQAEKSLTQKLETISVAIMADPTSQVSIEATDEEVTSWLDYYSIADPNTLFRNPQVKFETGKIKASAHVLKPVEIDLTVVASLSRADKQHVAIHLDEAYVGNIPLPKNLWQEAEGKIEEWLNGQFSSYNAEIDTLEILDGKAKFVGTLPPIRTPYPTTNF